MQPKGTINKFSKNATHIRLVEVFVQNIIFGTMNRQDFIKNLFSITLYSMLPTTIHALSPKENKGRVVVIGAGISGLAAAAELQKNGFEVVILESRNRIGGRIWTDNSLGLPLDMGAAWIHSPIGNPITALAKQANCKLYETNDDSLVVYDQNGKQIDNNLMDEYQEKYDKLLDKIEAESTDSESFKQAILRLQPEIMKDLVMLYQLSAYEEFDTGGDIEFISAKYWRNDEGFKGEDVILINGYRDIVEMLAKKLTIKLNHVVTKIDYTAKIIKISTTEGEFKADSVLVTVPLGVLKKGVIQFLPVLPAKKLAAIQQVGVGSVNKVALLFDKPFWDIKTQYIGHISEEKGKYNYFMNMRTVSQENVLVSFGFGDYGKKIDTQTDAEIEKDVMIVLRKIYGNEIPNPKKILVTRWGKDEFTYGCYSFMSSETKPKDYKILGENVDDKIFFAGEHTSIAYRATVHGAYLSGLEAAKAMME